MTDPHLEQLLDRYVDGALTDEDRAELERTLLTSPAAREAFWAHARLHADVTRWGQESWGRRMADEGEAAESSATSDGHPIGAAEGLASSRRLRIRPHLAPWLSAAAALVAVAVVLIGVTRKASTPVELTPTVAAVEAPATAPACVAVLTSAIDVEWDGPGPAGPGAVFASGAVLKLAAGAVQVEFYSGARLVIQAPAEVELRSEMAVYCRRGRLSANVPVPARGFTVGVGGVSVVDLGTEFGVDVPAEGSPEVHVFTGSVQVLRDAGGASAATRPTTVPAVTLGKGEGVRLVTGGKALEPIAAVPAAFLREVDIAKLAAGDARRRQGDWEQAAATLSRDPAAVAHYTFTGDAALARTVANRAAGASAEAAAASIVGCGFAEGRWPGTRAVEFQGAGDRVRLNMPGAFNAVTLLAWVRLDALPTRQASLLMSDGNAAGAVRWSLSEHGELRFGIARALGRPESDWEVVISEPLLTPERVGRWVLLATTYDGRSVRHYVDGRPAKSGAAFTPVPLTIGPAEVGNWRGTTPRALRGRMDELAVLSRAMSADEVRDLYEVGRPVNGMLP